MAKFPDYSSIGYANPLEIILIGKTLISEFDDLGEELRRQKYTYLRRDLTLSYRQISKINARTIWQFFQSRAARYETFNFFLPHTDSYEGEYVGTGDGSTTIWNLPAKTASSYTVYIDGNAQTDTIDYTITASGGADGADVISFSVAPSSGERITFDFTGYLKIRCRFADDNMGFQMFYARLTNIGISFKGLLNE